METYSRKEAGSTFYHDENQLICFVSRFGETNLYTYDGLHRRRTRTEYSWWGNNVAAVSYIYDGHLIIQERNADNLPLTTYTRGMDLSGTLGGAGGIGGLLSRTDHTVLNGRTDYYHQDGNGNVTYLVDHNQGLAAKYVYDPYGRVSARSGPIS